MLPELETMSFMILCCWSKTFSSVQESLKYFLFIELILLHMSRCPHLIRNHLSLFINFGAVI